MTPRAGIFREAQWSTRRRPADARGDTIAPSDAGRADESPANAVQRRLQQTALENAANAVLITDRRGAILWSNPAFTALTGYTAAEALGRTPSLIKSGQHDGAFYEALWRSLLAGNTWRGEFTNRRKDGTLYQGEQVITPVRDETGEISHFVAVMDDVTARRRAEAAERAAHLKLHHLLEHSPAVIYALKWENECIVPQVVSENVSRLLGFTPAETLSKAWWLGQLHPEDREKAVASIHETLTHLTTRTEYRLRHRDGSYRWVEDQRRLIRGAVDQPVELIGLWTDITERKQAEQVLRGAATRESDRRRKRMVTELALALAGVAVVFAGAHYPGWFKSAATILAAKASYPWSAETAGSFTFLLLALVGFSFRRCREGRAEALSQQNVAAALRTLHAELETRIRQRTAELAKANQELRAEIAERKRAENALEQERALMRTVIDQVPDLIYLKDRDSRFLLANAALGRLMKVSDVSELINRTGAEFQPADRAADFRADDLRVMAGHPVIEKEEVASDGSGRVFLTTKLPRHDLEGRVTGVIGIGRDITERKRVEQALRESQALYHSLVEQMPAGIFRKNAAGEYAFVNAAFARIGGLCPEDYLGKTAAAIAGRLALAGTEGGNRAAEFFHHGSFHHEELVRSGGRIEREEKVMLAGGREQYLEVVKTPVFDAGGQVIGSQGIVLDITMRKQAEAAVREADARFRQLTDNIREVFWLTDPEKNEVLYVSPAYERIWGRSCESLLQAPRSWITAIHPEDQPRIYRNLSRQLSGDYDEEYRIVRPDQSVSWIRDRAFPVRNEAGVVYRVAGLAEDITERKQAEDVLCESERRFREMLSNLQLIAMTLDRRGRITFCNDYLLRLTGWRREEAIGADWFDFFLPKSDATTKALFMATIGNGTMPAHHENPIVTRSGELRDIVWNNTLLRDPAANCVGTASIGEDVTERNRAAAALRHAKEQYQSIFQHAIEGIYQTEPDGAFRVANPAMARILGFASPEELTAWRPGAGESIYVNPRRRVEFRQKIEAEGVVTGFECEVFRKDGSRVWISENARLVEGKGGAGLCYEGSIEDITERKRAELRLELQHAVTRVLAEAGSPEQINQRILETVATGLQWDTGELWTVDRAADVLRCAETWHPAGSDFGAFVADTREMTFVRNDGLPGRVWAAGRTEWIPDVTLDAGCRRSAMASSIGLRSWMGFPIKLRERILGVVGFFSAKVHDVDTEMVSTLAALGSQLGQFIERQQLAEQFRQAQKMEAIGTLAGGIAHDFNNIIAAISGYTELAKMELEGNQHVVGHLDAVLTGSARAATLVRQILTFSRQQEHQRRPIQLRHIVTEALNLLRATIPATIRFEYSFERDLPLVLADPTQVHQVVMNLATNAWHAMKERPGRLGIKVEPVGVDRLLVEQHPGLRLGQYVRLSVSDTGHGMDRATLARIFEPFFTTKKPGEGTGLGLAVVHGVMQSHEGVVSAYSQPGEGTMFRAYFPVARGESSDLPLEGLSVPTGRGERILYVDDEQSLASMSARVLERLGYLVEAYSDPRDALAAARDNPGRYDLVITDLAMPVMTGTQLAQELLSAQPGLPVILITGFSANHTLAGVQALGICDLVTKPFSVQAIGAAVTRVLARTRKT